MNINKILGSIASLLVFVVISVGFYISGTPAEQRKSNFDSTRVQHLKSISRGVSLYVEDNQRLPESITMIIDGNRMSSLPRDPERNADYLYKVISDNTYNLCAEFSLSSSEATIDDFWYHPVGKHCYLLTAN